MLAFFLSGFLAFLLSRFLAFLLTFLLSSLRELCFIFALALIRSVSSTTRHRNTRSKARGSSDNAQEEHAGNQRATTATAENRLAGKSLQKSSKMLPRRPQNRPQRLPNPPPEASRSLFGKGLPFLVLFWSFFGPLGRLLVPSWGAPGGSWGRLGLSWPSPWPSWGAPGVHLGLPGGSWESFLGHFLKPPWKIAKTLKNLVFQWLFKVC